MTITTTQCAEILRDLRAVSGRSRSDMADLMGVSDRTYSRYESAEGLQILADFLTMVSSLSVNAMPVILRHIYPERFTAYSADTDPEACRSQLLNYISAAASPQDLLQLAFVLFGHHGSSAADQLQLLCLLDHLPMLERLLVCKMALNLYEIEASRSGLLNQEHIAPDLEQLRQRIITIQQSLAKPQP